jgi:predicted CXXCH cytochrome family protein
LLILRIADLPCPDKATAISHYQSFAASFILLLLLSFATQTQSDDYVGSDKCSACHAREYELWQQSHHYQAMLPATEENVLGDFSGRVFEYAGISSRFFKKNDKYYVETDNEKGELQEFEIAYTFGFHPLQQYLVPFPRGRYQALNIVWDSRLEKEGGQRWVHLYPDEAISHESGLHWTGSFQNWNSRCAACHSTRLRKNYNSSFDSYKTTWSEINVACEACHGPAETHLEWASAPDDSPIKQAGNAGFAFHLADRGPWGPANMPANTLSRLDKKRPQGQSEMCAACHARRSELEEDHSGKRFNDTFHLRLLERDLYYPDGQIDEEVYVYGSFLQSKMFQAGVVCTHCHDPHSNRLRAEDNSLCTQCHDTRHFDARTHHHHEEGSSGASCVSCHMPVKTFMVVDDRHDHSFRVPEPQLTSELGTPNTCNQCHSDRDAAWAVAAMNDWGVSPKRRTSQAGTLARAWRGDASVFPQLIALASDTERPAIVRATATLELGAFPSQETLKAIQAQLDSPDALVRAAAVRALDQMQAPQRYSLLQPLISDPVKSVRMEVARQLSELQVAQLPPEYAQELNTLREEYLQSMKLNADMPETQMNLGLYYAATGDPHAAEAAYRQAIMLSPVFIPAMLNLADLYRANGMDAQAKPLIEKAIKTAPGDPAAHHAMGLLLVRQGKLDQALAYLGTAAELDPMNTRYTYVYAVALFESGQKESALKVLESALEKHPGNRELVSALAGYYQQLGHSEKLQALIQKHTQ